MDIVALLVALAVLCVIAIGYIVFACAIIRRDVSHIRRDVGSFARAGQEVLAAGCEQQEEPGAGLRPSYAALVVNVVRRFYITLERKKARIRHSHVLWQENREAHLERIAKLTNRK